MTTSNNNSSHNSNNNNNNKRVLNSRSTETWKSLRTNNLSKNKLYSSLEKF